MSEASSPSTLGIREALRGIGLTGITIFVGICVASAVFTPAAAVLVLLWAWASGTPWRDIGLVRPESWLRGLAIGVALGLAEKVLLKAVILPLLGAPAVSGAFGDLAANPRRALFLIFYVTIGAGFCEELIFRGYLFERLGRLIGTSPLARTAGVIVATAFFAGLHYQQGLAGI